MDFDIYAAPTISTSTPNPVSGVAETTQTATFTVGDLNCTVTNVTATILAGGHLGPNSASFSSSISGNTVTMTIQGKFDQWGTNTVQVVAEDNNGFTGANTFTLQFSYFDHGPSVGFIGRQVTSAGSVLGPIPVTVTSIDVPLSQVTVTATSDNQKLIPDANLVLQSTGLGTYNLTIFPMGTSSDTANITITANDGTKTATTVFQVFVQAPGVPLFAAPSSIFVVPNAPGIGYPSTNTVSGLIGQVEHVSVTLFDITDPTPGGLQVLLVGPTGTNVLLMANAGDNNPLNNTTLVFDDSATGRPAPERTNYVRHLHAQRLRNYHLAAGRGSSHALRPGPVRVCRHQCQRRLEAVCGRQWQSPEHPRQRDCRWLAVEHPNGAEHSDD